MAISIPEPHITHLEKRNYGIFIHWNFYAQLSKGEWIQYLRKISM